MAYGGHFGFLPTTTYAHTFERDTPPVSFIEDKNTKKRTFALHGHGSAPDDPTISELYFIPKMAAILKNGRHFGFYVANIL